MTGRPDSLREKRCILVRASGVFICDHVASLFLDLSWGRTSWRKQHELPRMARKQKRHNPEEGTREKHTFQRPLYGLFSPNRLYLIFITSHQIMTLPIISSFMKLYPMWANHLPKPTSEHCFMGTKVSTYKSLEKHFHTQLRWLASIFTWHYLEITLKESLKEGWSMLGWHVGMSEGDCLNSANW